jgi:hypothetical protein
MPQENAPAVYRQLIAGYTAQYNVINRKHNQLSLLRLGTALLTILLVYIYFDAGQLSALYMAFAGAVVFVLLMKWHSKTAYQKLRLKTLLQINGEELDYLDNGALPFADGSSYREALHTHAYAADLDLFGSRSLYQHLNRTATQPGKDRLAHTLLNLSAEQTISERQGAIAELGPALAARQEYYAAARMAGDNLNVYERLISWTKVAEPPFNKALLVICYVLSGLLTGGLLLYACTHAPLYSDIALKLFLLNLFIFTSQLKRIRKAMFGVDKVHEVLQNYSVLLRQVEEADYRSPYLIQLKEKLHTTGTRASISLQQLASVYARLETVQNPFAAIITNGLYFNHIFALQKLSRWKTAQAANLNQWLEVIGEMEMLNSLANLHYNNPGFSFPSLNSRRALSFTGLGHPLIPSAKRVCNDISFDNHRFVILTGSNMSGKSTFLRTLGVNMVLAGTGSVVCAQAASIHPLPVFVSMRQSDSLADSESYFFAEVKRLRYIMDQLALGTGFVLLDEILRGTNSDDKRSGTIGVIEKIIRQKAIGAIATHDLEVCLTTDAHPDILSNKCFEVEIINNELVFDYRLREGICQNKSATFLMKKMEIIA